MTAECLACSQGVTPKEYCANPSWAKDTADCDKYQAPPPLRACCMAFTAECLSCSRGVTTTEFCANPAWARDVPDCDQFAPVLVAPKMCCMALTAECVACSRGISPEEYCANPAWARDVADCDQYQRTRPRPHVHVCCRALTAACLSCTYGVTPEEYCANPKWSRHQPDCARYSKPVAPDVMDRSLPAGHKKLDSPRMCCMAMTASCLSCTKGVTPEEYCANAEWARNAPDCGRYLAAGPSKVRYLTVSNRTSTSAVAHWVPPKSGFDCQKDKYAVYYKRFGKQFRNWRKVDSTMQPDSSDPVVQLSGLEPNRRYVVKVTPYSMLNDKHGVDVAKRFQTRNRRN